jgi:hypothetical protein
MSIRPKKLPIRDTFRTDTRGRSADKYLEKRIGPFSGRSMGPSRRAQTPPKIADPPAPMPKKRKSKFWRD